MAESRLKSRIVLDQIAEKEKITVENDDISKAIMQQASMSGQKPEALVKELRSNQGQIENMRDEIRIGKTLNFLLEKADRTVEDQVEAKVEAKG
jgi:trigger factor